MIHRILYLLFLLEPMQFRFRFQLHIIYVSTGKQSSKIPSKFLEIPTDRVRISRLRVSNTYKFLKLSENMSFSSESESNNLSLWFPFSKVTFHCNLLKVFVKMAFYTIGNCILCCRSPMTVLRALIHCANYFNFLM